MREVVLAFALSFAITAAVLYATGAYDEAWAEFAELLEEVLR